eukprot:4041694-Prymnesium_polylepis.1
MAASHGHGVLDTVCSSSASPARLASRPSLAFAIPAVPPLPSRSRSLHALLQVPQRTHLPSTGFMASGAVPGRLRAGAAP